MSTPKSKKSVAVTTAKAVQPVKSAKPALKAVPSTASKTGVKPAAGASRPVAPVARKSGPAKPALKAKSAQAPQAPLKPAPVKTQAKTSAPAKPAAKAVKASLPVAAKASSKTAPKTKPDAKPLVKPAPAPDPDMAEIEADLAGEPVAAGEKVKPLRMKISKAKERALMKEFGLDETVLSEEDIVKRRQRLKALIKLGKTRGYLTHGEISDHLPDKLVDPETMEVVVSMLNDMGVAVYEHTPDAETLLINNNSPTAATEEEAEEEAEAALSTVDSEFGRTT
ncbi:MAG: RNA polymerase sigma factor RpoD, partial [Burkholderiales bacterium]|nr:RNA polymerase sigma factor RpoD [Burkholderiales bacterium]